jgi:hypothetical protein
MSILKSILHRWNSTSKAYDTLHPETESSQITDWHTGIMNSLASTTLGTVVSALTTDSVAGKLLKLLLDASGVKYSLGTNGYVCLGSFFGGLIIQWGRLARNEGYAKASVTLPLTVPSMTVTPFVCPEATNSDGRTASISAKASSSKIEFNLSGNSLSFSWMAICHR